MHHYSDATTAITNITIAVIMSIEIVKSNDVLTYNYGQITQSKKLRGT